MRSFIRRVLPIVLAVALLLYALKDVSFADITHQFSRADYMLVGCATFLVVLSYGVRGKRWQQPLLALGYTPTVFRATVALLSGTIASIIIPGSGELTRCATLQRTDGVPIAQGIGSVVAERVIDLGVMGLTVLLAFALEFGRMSQYLVDLHLAKPGGAGWWLVGAGLVGLLALLWLLRWAVRHPVLGQSKFTQKAVGVGRGIWAGFSAIRRLRQPVLFVLLTIAYQLLTWLATYLLLLSIDTSRSLPATAALTVLAVASLGGLAVPTQGGIGTFHFLVSRVLVLYGLTTAQGTLVATFIHTVGFGISLLLSSLSFLIIPSLIRRQEPMVNQKIDK